MKLYLPFLALLLLVSPTFASSEVKLPGIPPFHLSDLSLQEFTLPNMPWDTRTFQPLLGQPYGAGTLGSAPLLQTQMYESHVPDTPYNLRQWSRDNRISIYQLSGTSPISSDIPGILHHISSTVLWLPQGTIPQQNLTVFKGTNETLLFKRTDASWNITLFSDPNNSAYDLLSPYLSPLSFTRDGVSNPASNEDGVGYHINNSAWALAHQLSGYTLSVNIAPTGTLWFTWTPSSASMRPLIAEGHRALSLYLAQMQPPSPFTYTKAGFRHYGATPVLHAGLSTVSQEYLESHWEADAAWVANVQTPPLRTTWEDTHAELLSQWYLHPGGNILSALFLCMGLNLLFNSQLVIRMSNFTATCKPYCAGLGYLVAMTLVLAAGQVLNFRIGDAGTLWPLGLLLFIFNLSCLFLFSTFLTYSRLKTLGYQTTWQILLLVPGANFFYLIALVLLSDTPDSFQEGLPPDPYAKSATQPRLGNDVGDLVIGDQ
jgi:hypothetical protein